MAALVHAVADTLSARFSACTVRGELSGYSRAASGHCYFTLKDAEGAGVLIRCAMFRRAASLVDFSASDGQLVEVRGRLAVYEPRGELQFVVESMQRAGAGALFEQFLKLKARLETEGLFDPSRKRAVPAYPQRIGVITSRGAAALRDVLTALARRAPHVEVVVYPSLVQGAEAPAALVEALATAASRAETDVLILCRGGGSLEDLWAFNDETVVRAVASCAIPVICGVGHETDVSLADFAAGLRAPTPTAAAELATPARQECIDVLAGLAVLMNGRLRQALETHAQRLDRAALRLFQPADVVRRQAHRLALLQHRLAANSRLRLRRQMDRHDDTAVRLQRALVNDVLSRQERLGSLEARLNGLDPRRVLSRGYAWLTDAGGRPVMSAATLAPGQQVRAVFSDGHATATIDEVLPGPPRQA